MPERLPAEKFEPVPWSTLELDACGEQTSGQRVIVRIVRCGTRLLDRENLWGSIKALVDQLRYARLIREDNEKEIDLRVSQLKVRKAQIATYVRISYPSTNQNTTK